MIVIESKGITDVGKKRPHNEDALFVDDELRLYIVADGMGGHQAGEVASELVVETIRDYMKRFWAGEQVEELADSDETLSREANRLISGILLANRGVYQVSQSHESYRGMGSTLSAAYFTDETLIVANVGDSPIYLVHNGNIELLSVTHNVVSEQAAINPEVAERLSDEIKRLLTRAMGIEETVEPDVCEIQFFKDDILVISSDGLSDLVSPDEILGTVKNERPQRACRKLVELANERGGHDNITVIVLKIKTTGEKTGIFSGVISRSARGLIEMLRRYT